jgi:DNA repair protein RadC
MNYKTNDEIWAVSEVKISYHPTVKPSQRPQLNSSSDIYRLLAQSEVFPPSTIEYKEYFKVMLFNNANRLLGITHLSEGGINETTVDIRHIMQAAILANAVGIILCHNHPSGNCQPSPQDDSITRKVQAACKLFNIKLLDHLILSSESYCSYADEGRLEEYQ